MTDRFETRVKELAGEFSYPTTPPVARKVMARIHTPSHTSRKLAWALTILLLAFFSLMAVPTVRAAVIEFVKIGVVYIFPSNETSPTQTPDPQTTPSIAPTSLIPFLESIGEETTLAEARRIVDYPIAVPTYPTDLGNPDRVFLQDAGEAMVILIWNDEKNEGQVRMSLHIIPLGSWMLKKASPEVIEITSVNGQQAVWTTGPYPLIMQNRDIQFTRLIEGHVLIWTEGDLTYRLETDLSLEEAIRVAESLQAPPEITPTP